MKYRLIFFVSSMLYFFPLIAEAQKAAAINDTVITNIRKSCMADKNINDYELCKNWKLLTAKDIIAIISNADTCTDHTLHYAATKFPFWMLANMATAGKKYEVKINAGSFFQITDKTTNVSKLYCSVSNKYRKFFISNIGAEDDSLYKNIKRAAIQNTKPTNKHTLQTGIFTFTNTRSGKKYSIVNNNKECFIQTVNNKNEKLQCSTLTINKNKIIFYARYKPAPHFNFANTNDGDYIFTLKNVAGKFCIQSNLLGSGSVVKQKI